MRLRKTGRTEEKEECERRKEQQAQKHAIYWHIQIPKCAKSKFSLLSGKFVICYFGLVVAASHFDCVLAGGACAFLVIAARPRWVAISMLSGLAFEQTTLCSWGTFLVDAHESKQFVWKAC